MSVLVLAEHDNASLKPATKDDFEKERETYVQGLLAAKQAEALTHYTKRLREAAKDDYQFSALLMGVTLAVACVASAAPNVTNATQKGSLLIWSDIRVDNAWNTLVRIQNDGSLDVDVICYWMDGNKNRVDFIFTITRNQPVWFDARTGQGTYRVNPFPSGPANGFDNPFLVGPWAGAGTTCSTGRSSTASSRGACGCSSRSSGGASRAPSSRAPWTGSA